MYSQSETRVLYVETDGKLYAVCSNEAVRAMDEMAKEFPHIYKCLTGNRENSIKVYEITIGSANKTKLNQEYAIANDRA